MPADESPHDTSMAAANPAELQVCVKTTLPIDRDMEDAMKTYFWQLVDKTHKDEGYAAWPNTYTYGSFLWKRLSWMQRFENDFSDRLYLPREEGGELFQMSNRSLNFPKQFVDSHHANTTEDLDQYGFLSVEPEGGEDEHPALALLERYLRERALRIKLGPLLKNELVRQILIAGERVARIRKDRKARFEPRKVRAVRDQTQPGDVALKDSRGGIVSELDVWVPDPLKPERKLLQRDRKVFHRVDVPMELTQRTYTVNHVVKQNKGAVVDFIHPGDFVFETNQPTLDDSIVVGDFVSMATDDLFDLFDPNDITEAGRVFMKQYGVGSATSLETNNATAAKTHQGESPNQPDGLLNAGAAPRRRFFQGYFRYDWNGDGRRERVFMVMDWVTRTPIAYEAAHLVLESDERLHDYKMLAVRKRAHRAYGEGIYEKFDDLSQVADQKWNRIQIEEASSGKVVVFNPNALQQTKAGGMLKFRGPVLYNKVNPQDTAKEILDVIQIPAETAEMRENMSYAVQTMASRGGGVTPGESEQAGLPAAQTATGLQILQQAKNALDQSVTNELAVQIRELLQAWATVEVENFDEELATKLFEGKMVAVPPPPSLPMAPAQAAAPNPATDPMAPTTDADGPMNPAVTPEGMPQAAAPAPAPGPVMVPAIQVLKAWLAKIKPEDLQNYVHLVEARTKNADLASAADNRVKLINQYSQLPPMLQEALENEYEELLRLNGSQNPEKTLKDIQQATVQQMMAAQAQAQAEAEAQAMQAKNGGAAPAMNPAPPEGEQVPTGRPQFNEQIGVPAEPMI